MARTTVSLTIIAIILTVTSIYTGIMATPTTVLGFTDRVVLQTSEILDLLKGLEVEHFEQSNPQIITQASSLGELPLESSSIKFAVAISSSPEFPNDGLLKEILRVLKPDGIVIVQKEASSTIERKLLLAGYLDAQDLQINSTAISGNVSVVKARKPSWKIGSSFSLKKPSKSIPTIQLNDDDDLIDEDSLLTEEDLKKPQLPAVGDCEIGSTKKACKNCMCGKTMDQLNNPQSTCGSCGLGDAFRCGSCPYKGLPPFKMGKKGIMARTTTSITIIAVILTVLLKKFRPKPKPYLVDDVRDELEGSGSSPPFSGYEYDVFLSFRGPDTRKGFTDCLYHALIDAGIRTFRDDESIRTGKEIGTNLIRAIAESKIHIPVLSKDYASTKRCLKELTLIMKFNKERDHMILPVFYDVNPAEVQDQTGDYGRALEKHHEKYGPEVVSSWKETLCKVGHLKGMDLVKLANGYQGQFIKLIVSKVLSGLKKSQLVVTEKLIGIDEHVEAIKQLLQFDASDVRIIGIWGMGGIGKTTLAKVIYNQILHSFECYSFIKDVRETSRCNGLPYLQSSLVADLSRREPPPFKSVDEGINELKHMYCQKKVLIVVDDIDDTDQLDALVIGRDSFGPGSRILVTTRNKHILDSVEVDCIYEAQTMSEDNALKLFYKHSLRRDSPTDELSDLSIEIVKSLGWLPLAVEVIGSFLYGKSVLIWKETLKKLRTIPNEKVQDKLLVSFNTLDHEQKQIFLDIACFFIGEDISKMFFMWEDCMFFPEFGIYVLVDYSLVKIVDNNKIWMHDQLRDIGREIVRRESCTNPGMRSRLWHTEDVEDVLTNQMPASSNVEAIRLHPSEDKAIRMLGTSSGEEKHIFTSEQFRKHLNLRFLDLKNVHLAGDIAIPSLRWLRCTHSSVDSSINIHLLNLVTLELVKTNLSHDWNGWASIPMRLKVLNLNGSANLTKTPTFSGFPNLERLTLSHCSKLEVIDSSIGELQNLTYLDINNCDRVRELPYELISLKKLEFLDLSKCGELIGIPSSIIGHLLKLQTLNLRDCRKLETFLALPDHLYNQQVHKYIDLIILDISGCQSVTTLPNLSNLKSLKTLNASNCIKLEGLVGLDKLCSLESLNIRGCSSIERLPDLSKLQKLERFCAYGCYKLQELVGVDEVKSLKKLEITGKNIKLPNLSKLKQLEELSADCCLNLQEIVGFGDLNALKVISLSMCRQLRKLPDLSKLNRLEVLHLFRCEKLQELIGLDQLCSLESLKITYCYSIKRLPDLSNLQKLKVFRARRCYKLQEFVGVDEVKSLKKLQIAKCTEMEKLPNLSKLKQLEELYADGCEKLQEIVGFGDLNALKTINLEMCKQLSKLPDLSKLNCLKALNLLGCEELEELIGLDQLYSLKSLNITNCYSIKRLPDLSKLQKLEVFCANNCYKLQELVGVDEVKSLKRLQIRECKEIEKIPNLSKLKHLEELYADYCEKLQEIVGFGDLNALKVISLRMCKQLRKLPDLSKLNHLGALDLFGCKKLQELIGIDQLCSLERLNITNCYSIERLSDLSKLQKLKVFCDDDEEEEEGDDDDV